MATSHTPDRFVLLPFRKGEKDTPDWSQCAKYINTHHPGNFSVAVDDALKSMSACHNTIVKTCTLSDTKSVPTTSFAEHTLKHYCKLVLMAQGHVPLNGGKIHKDFKFVWYDSFTGSKYDSTNSNCEVVSCVYNLAASYAYIAANQAQNGTEEDVKQAFQGFQNAAGYFNLVQDLLPRMPADQLTKGDMRKDSLQMITKLSLAMAHHCGYLKAETAVKDNHEMLSKIACHAANLYEEAHTLMKTSPWYTSTSIFASLAGKNTSGKDVAAQLDATRLIFLARANIHLGRANEIKGEMGVTIAYYLKAKSYLAALPKLQTSAQTAWVNSIVNALNKAHEDAERANNTVYYARVPKEVNEPASLPRALGQAVDFSDLLKISSKRGVDPFFGIVPAHIANEANMWREKQRKAINACQSTAANARKNVKDKLQVLGVASIIQSLSAEVQDKGRVPEPLRSKILAMRNGDEGRNTNTTERLVHYVNTCKQLTEASEDRVKAIEAELAKEKEQDAKFVTSYGEKMWRSVCPVSEQTPDYTSIQAALDAHKSGWAKWFATPFAEAQQTLDANLRDIARLDWPMADLDALMPFVKTKEARHQSDQVMQLVETLKTLMARRDDLEKQQLADQASLGVLLESDDITFGLSAVEATEKDAILAKGSQQVTEGIEKVNAVNRDYGALLAEAEKTVEKLGELQSADPITAEIQKVSNGLENATSVYAELCKEYDSITQYGTKAVDKLNETLGSAQSFTLVRKLSAEELQLRLDAQIARKMDEMSSVQGDIEKSRQRQRELENELNALQQARGSVVSNTGAPLMAPPSYDSAMNSTYSAPPSYHSQVLPPISQQPQQGSYYQQQPPPPPQQQQYYQQQQPQGGYYQQQPQQQQPPRKSGPPYLPPAL